MNNELFNEFFVGFLFLLILVIILTRMMRNVKGPLMPKNFKYTPFPGKMSFVETDWKEMEKVWR